MVVSVSEVRYLEVLCIRLGRTGTPSSSQISLKRAILRCISFLDSSQNPTSSACSKPIAAASWRGETEL